MSWVGAVQTGAAAARTVEASVIRAWDRFLSRWQQRPDLGLDHGHIPYAAWEAELGAYARLRAGAPISVRFALAAELGWRDEIHLAKAPSATAATALDAAELELEHALMHFRDGTREAALFWRAWVFPDEEVLLPWPPWDQVPLPMKHVRQALAEAVADFELPSGYVLTRDRLRHASRWIFAAWEDGAHRRSEIVERPGLAARLPLPVVPPEAGTWYHVLGILAGGETPDTLGDALQPAVRSLLEVGVEDVRNQIACVLAVTDTLERQGLLPPIHQQRPAWLGAPWGRWRYGQQLCAALDRIARSPQSAETATLIAQRRRLRARPREDALGRGSLGSRGGLAGRAGNVTTREEGDQALSARLVESEPSPKNWGVPQAPSLPKSDGPATSSPAPPTAEGGGEGGASAGSGAGPGTLGALRIVVPSQEDRAAYWQLRGALAPQIETLIARLEAAGDAYYASAPRRLQRRGRLDRARLAVALAGRETVFTRFVHAPAPEHALCLLLDCSASLGALAEQLREFAIVTEAGAAAVGAHVTAFSFGPSWERMAPPAQGAPLTSLGRELHPQGGTPFGPALAAAASWLAQQAYQHKRLWVFTDGRWNARDRAQLTWRAEQLRNVVVWVIDEHLPTPPHPAMHMAAVPTLADLVSAAPRYFWSAPDNEETRLDVKLPAG
jgi:hypothetical protein